jgi:H+-translocating NAD(P) transhydrogenase subunit alpha
VPVLFVPRERARGERRVAATPDSVRRLTSADLEVVIETGAGERAGASDDDYREAGARIHDGPSAPTGTDLVARVAPPTRDEVELLPEGVTLLSLIAPHRNQDSVRSLAERRVTTLAMELVPRISRAQAMDALSSQASIAGYRAVIVAAHEATKLFPLFMTAAGTIRPANVVVLGAGVAGLQAVATARRLGAVVYVSDVREAAREEVASLGGRFIEVPDARDLTGAGGYAQEVGDDFLARQQAVLNEHLSSANAVICTAQIPGRRAPQLVTAAMVDAMRPGSVVIDLAAADGGNCALTDADGVVEHHGVRILPGQHLPSEMADEASALYARNIAAFLGLLVGDGAVRIDRDDEVIAGALLTHDGEVTHPPTATLLEGAA